MIKLLQQFNSMLIYLCIAHVHEQFVLYIIIIKNMLFCPLSQPAEKDLREETFHVNEYIIYAAVCSKGLHHKNKCGVPNYFYHKIIACDKFSAIILLLLVTNI